MSFYNHGERKKRAGVYMRFSNRSNNVFKPSLTESGGEAQKPAPTMLLKDSRGVLLKSADGLYLAVRNI